MGYIGVDINYGNIAKQVATSPGGGSTTPTGALTYTVPTSESIMVTLDGVTQVPGTDFNVTGGTVLTFTTSVPADVVVLVYFLGRSLDIGTPADNTVTSAKIVNGTIVNDDVNASAAIVTSKLSGAVTSIASHGLGALASLATVGTTQIDNDSVTGAKLNPALVAGDIIYADGTDTITRLAKPGTPANEVLTFATSATAPSWVAPAGGGVLVQQVTNHTNALVTGTTVLPQDTTIPQNDEGNALFECAITPTSATNRLRMVVLVNCVTAADGQILGLALFQDSTADALNSTWGYNDSGNQNHTLHMDYEMAAGTTSETIFKVRGGRSPAGTFHMNRSLYLWMGSPPRYYSSITIQEIAV